LKRDHRPYFIKKADQRFQDFYVKHFLRPQLESLGTGFAFRKPWHVEIFGPRIELGNYVNVIATSDKKVRLAVWPESEGKGCIRVGNYCLICPGVRIGSASKIIIGDNCMIAGHSYITDSDWHDIYNRVSSGKTAPVIIKDNVWIADSAIICKGVTIGENSIIGAGSVVVNDIEPNIIAAGNPAGEVKRLDPKEPTTTRAHWFSDPVRLYKGFDMVDRDTLRENTVLHWLRSMLFPVKED